MQSVEWTTLDDGSEALLINGMPKSWQWRPRLETFSESREMTPVTERRGGPRFSEPRLPFTVVLRPPKTPCSAGEILGLGESVLALGHMDLTARTTGIEFSQELGEVFDFRAGKIVRCRDYLTHAEALEAAGLSE